MKEGRERGRKEGRGEGRDKGIRGEGRLMEGEREERREERLDLVKFGVLEQGTQRVSPQASTDQTNHSSSNHSVCEQTWDAKENKIPSLVSRTSVWLTHLVGETGT